MLTVSGHSHLGCGAGGHPACRQVRESDRQDAYLPHSQDACAPSSGALFNSVYFCKFRCEGSADVLFLWVQDLFTDHEESVPESEGSAAPLATRMRPRTLEEFVGQEHI